jgi:PIN domain nuclease of toxin-antitoxin system
LGRAALRGFLLDTHIWLWYLLGNPRLPAGLRRTIDRSPEECCLSPASVWELGLLQSRGRVELDAPLRAWFQNARDILPARECPLTMEVAVTAAELDPDVKDPADRLLAASSLVHDLVLMTLDEHLAAAAWLRTRSR